MAHVQEQLSSLFDWLLGSTFQASILVVLVLLLQAVLRRRIAARWYHLLWLIVVIRMALPWAPQSRLSLFNWVPSFAETPPSEPAPVPAVADAPVLPAAPASAMPLAPMPEQLTVDSSELATESQPLVRRLPPPRRIAEWLWLAAAVGLAGWATFVNARFWKRVRGASVVTDAATLQLVNECSRQMGLKSPPQLVETDAVAIPSLYGLLRPRMLLPPGLVETLSTAQLRHVFLHEMAHLKRLDTAAGLLATAVQILHWFNPFAWLAFRRMRADREMACDTMVLSRLQSGETRAYAQTLIKLAERIATAPWRPGVAGILEGRDSLERRITMITRFGGTRRSSSLVGLALMGIIGCAALTNPHPASQSETSASGFSPGKSYVITPGQGIDVIHVGDSAGQVEAVFGKPPKTQDTGNLRWLNYREQLHIDFLLNKASDRVIEIRFNTGFKGVLPDGTRLGDLLDSVLSRSGGAKKKVNANREQTSNCDFGDDRVLYTRRSLGFADAYKFVDGKNGVLYWFGKNKKLNQIVVFAAPATHTEKEVELPEGSHIDANGRIVDKIDYPFVDDPQVRGTWQSVDFVRDMKEFNPASPKWKGDLYLKELVILPNGRTFRPWWTWTKGMIFHSGDHTASRYTIRDLGGATYMFFEWKSGDYSIMHRKPQYYVLKKVSSDTAGLGHGWAGLPTDAEFARTLQSKVDQLDIGKADLQDVVKIFGRPAQYLWGNKEFKSDRLPDRYIMIYPAGFRVAMYNGHIGELRFERPGPGYVFEGRLKVGSSLEDVLKVLGQPSKTVTGEKCMFESGVLYQDMNGRPGWGYYARAERNVRMFLEDGKIIALYVTRPESK